MSEQDYNKVICPECNLQFRAIPVVVQERIAELEAENQRLRDMLESAWERMDRAREILTDGKPSKHNNWGMLDTTLNRQALEKER